MRPHDIAPAPMHDAPVRSPIAPRLPEIEALCRHHGVRRLDLFGSVARGDSTPDSDIDFLVDLGERQPADDARAYFDLKDALETLFGQPVDLVTPAALRNPYFRSRIEAERVRLYAP
jgi:predicted nucleotidyltransferase